MGLLKYIFSWLYFPNTLLNTILLVKITQLPSLLGRIKRSYGTFYPTGLRTHQAQGEFRLSGLVRLSYKHTMIFICISNDRRISYR
jgi:hypothetical protein